MFPQSLFQCCCLFIRGLAQPLGGTGMGGGGSGQAQINVEGCVRERKMRREGSEKMEAVL